MKGYRHSWVGKCKWPEYVAPVDNWLLKTGSWNDNGFWDDDKLWIDG